MNSNQIQRPYAQGNGNRPANQQAQGGIMPQPTAALTGIIDHKAASEVARILGQIQIANAMPRNMYEVEQEVESAFSRIKLANEAVYTFARGGSSISGPTIRTLEQVASCMRHIISGFEVVETNEREHWTKILCYAHDLQRNNRSEITVNVSHKRTGKNQQWLTDPRDIQETIKSQASRNIRSCLQRIIPDDIVEYALEVASNTIKQNININAQTIENLRQAFHHFGVNKEMLEKFIQRNLSAITADQYVKLRQIWTSLNDGVAKVEDFFDVELSDAAQSARKASQAIEQKQAEELPQTSPQEAPETVVEAQQKAPAQESQADSLEALWEMGR